MDQPNRLGLQAIPRLVWMDSSALIPGREFPKDSRLLL